MKKPASRQIDIFFLLISLEGLAALFLLLTIPADPKNQVLFGLSLQRLLLASALLLGVLTFFVFFIIHVRKIGKGAEILEEFFMSRKTAVRLEAVCSILFALGLISLWGLFSTYLEYSPALLRMAPLLGWLGLTGLQGIFVFVWFDRRIQVYQPAIGYKWIVPPITLVLGVAYLAWFLIKPGDAGLFLRNDLITAGVLLLLIISVLLSQKGKAWLPVQILVSIMVFLIPLFGIWSSGISDPNFVTGLFPFNDAHGYYLGARRLADGGTLNSFAAHRPLFPGFLGFLFWISSQNLQISVLILVVLAGLASFLFSIEIRRTHGALAAGLAFLLAFLFFRRFIGSTMTETQGFAMGAAGFAVLWRSIADRRLSGFIIGLTCLSISLNARAGPLFILPVLVLWAGWYFRASHRLFSWKTLVIATLAAAVGFAGNFLVFRAAAEKDSAPFSNFSYTLYGTVAGGKGWKHVLTEHPEVAGLQEPELSRTIYSMAIDEFRRNPAGLVEGSFKAWNSFLSLEFYGMFGFVQGGNSDINGAFRLFLFLLSLGGVIAVFRWFKEGQSTFILASALGIWLSVPFVPPLDAEIRTYAAVIPLFIILACVGLAEGIGWIGKLLNRGVNDQRNFSGAAVFTLFPSRFGEYFASIFSLAAILGPLAVWFFARPPQISEIFCPGGEAAVYVRINPGSYIQVVEDQSVDGTWLPVIRWSDFARGIHDFAFYSVTEELDTVAPPTTLAYTVNLKSLSYVWLIADSRLIPQTTGVYGICGEWSPSTNGNEYGFFYGNSFQLIQPDGAEND